MSDVIDPKYPTTNFSAIKIINSKISGSLVLVGEKGKASGFSCFFVSDEPEIDYFPELREHDGDVALVHAIVEVADEDVGAVVILVPRS